MKARDVMTEGVEVIDIRETIDEAARRMASQDIGAMPICNEEGRLQGMITDRDIVVKVVAAGKDPTVTTAGELFDGGQLVTIGADDPIEEAMRTMIEHKVRRLPVIDGHKLVGMVSQGDLAQHLPEAQVGKLVEDISAAP